jgi:hypothetical protein
MKRTFFVLVCALISADVFAESGLLDEFERNTSEGQYFVSLYSVGKNLGRQTAAELIRNDRNNSLYTVETDIKLSNVKWDLIRQTLDRYKHSRGDTYAVVLYNTTDWFAIQFVVEYTSATQYTYWTWLVYHTDGLPMPPLEPFYSPDNFDPGTPPPLPPEW